MSGGRLNSTPRKGLRIACLQPICSIVLVALELRYGVSSARSGGSHGRSAKAGRWLFARDIHLAPRQGAVPGARVPESLSQSRLHEQRRKLARTAQRRNRVHDATAAQRRLGPGAAKFRIAPFWNNLKAGEFSWGVVT